MSRIELLEGDDKGCSFGGDARVDGLGAHEPRTVEVLYYRTVWDWQTAQDNVEAGNARRDQAIHDPAHSRMLSPIHQLRDVLWAGRNDDTGGSHDATVVQADAAHMAVTDLDALHSDIANDTCPGPQPVNQRTPSAVYVVDGIPERPLQLLDEQLRTNEVQRRTVDEGAREPRHQPAQLRATDILVQPTLHACVRQGLRFGSAERQEQSDQRQLVYRIQQVGSQKPERIRREGTQLASVHHKGPFRDAVVVRDAELLQYPRGRTTGVEGVAASVEPEAVEILG